jgi:hypothetical protein
MIFPRGGLKPYFAFPLPHPAVSQKSKFLPLISSQVYNLTSFMRFRIKNYLFQCRERPFLIQLKSYAILDPLPTHTCNSEFQIRLKPVSFPHPIESVFSPSFLSSFPSNPQIGMRLSYPQQGTIGVLRTISLTDIHPSERDTRNSADKNTAPDDDTAFCSSLFIPARLLPVCVYWRVSKQRRNASETGIASECQAHDPELFWRTISPTLSYASCARKPK